MLDVNAVKNELNITYQTDLAIEQKLAGILKRAVKILGEYAGIPDGEELDEVDEELILGLCRYIWNGAYEDFQKNFAAELFQLRAKYAVRGISENEEKNEPVSEL